MKQFFPHTDKSLPIQIQKALNEDYISADKRMLIISFLSFLGTAFITSYSHNTYFLGVVGGAVAFIISVLAYVLYKGTLISRLLFGIIFMIYPSIMLQQQLGMIEMHFAFFYMVSFLMMYKDISSILIGALVVTIHHISLTYLQLNDIQLMGTPLLVFGPNCSWTITFIHMIMWTFALVVYMYIIIKNTQRFIKMKTDQIELITQSEEVDNLNQTLEKKVARRTFELSEQKHVFETLFNETSDGISLIKEGKFIDCNNAVLELLEYKSKEDFLNLKPYQLSPEFQPDGQKSKDKEQVLIESCLKNGRERFEWLHTKSTGDHFWTEIVLTKIRIKNEDIIHVVWRDITNKKELDEQIIYKTEELEESNEELQTRIESLKQAQDKLIESEKMASLGNLVAGVAHEINTPLGVGLTGISHFMDITKDLKKEYESENMSIEEFETYLKKSYELAGIINTNLENAANLVKNFKLISTDQINDDKREFDLEEYINNVIYSLNSLFYNTNIKVNVISQKNLIINSYPGLFAQIVTNLITNSIKHAYEEKSEGLITLDLIKEDNNFIIKYTDDGKGIQKENLSKIFEPFFTTNREKNCTGLGLNIIYNIVTSNLNGTIECNSKVNKGVVFTITLPLDYKST